ncbi:MAG: peptidoglycan/LPS O-acetylase OafA/YrhL [Psychromonas sp.]|uniref:acyltransferase family protein n=1 Tax=Psychromonas sp. TaxID=1884585 RepID=UPI0039E34498
MTFRKDLNGLRAIAVIAVVLFHFNESWMPGGFAGVDVFFVISGFLMTGIIFRGIEQNNFSILNFYIARVNRIIPALAVLCFFLLILGWFYLTPIDYKALSKHASGSITFLSNIMFWKESGYFDAASHEKWLLHTWSLSTEWQFYIIYPLLLVALRKCISFKAMKTTILFGTILGFIFCTIATYKWPTPAYYLLPTRFWEMMAGGVAYLYPFSGQHKKNKILEWCGLTLIMGSYLFMSKDTPWPGYLAIFPVLGSFLVIQSQCGDSFITGNVIFQKLGSWSYSIYLWHWPIVAAFYYFSLDEIYLGILLSIFLGGMSYTYIEKIKFRNDFRGVLEHLKCKPIYMLSFIVLLSLYISSINGKNGWIVKQDLLTKQTYSILAEMSPQAGNWGTNLNGKQDYSDCRFNVKNLTSTIELRLKKCESSYGAGIMILGDSHAKDLFGMVSSRFNDPFIVGITNSEGCRPHTHKKFCQYEKVRKFLSTNANIFKHIIYEQGGLYLLLDKKGNKGSRDMLRKLGLFEKVEGVSLDTVHISRVTDYLKKISNFAPVTWFSSRVEPQFTNRQVLNRGCNFKFELRKNQLAAFRMLDKKIESNITQINNIKFLSQNEILDYKFPEDFMSCEKILWDDGDHLSSLGEETLGKRLPSDFLIY